MERKIAFSAENTNYNLGIEAAWEEPFKCNLALYRALLLVLLGEL